VEILEIPAKELRQVRHQAGEAIQVDSANSSEILARISHAESLNQSLLQEVRRLSESLESVIQFVRSDSGIPNTSQNAPIEGIGEGDERAESTTESTSETVLRLAGLGWSKNDIIRHVWGASPGGSRAYKDAKAEYEAIVG
jgi:antitoxin component of MazEF toxin-antitoxin module